MSEFKDLVAEIKTQRAKAARFFRTDFHLHSPFSKDWQNGSGNPILDRNTKTPVDPLSITAYYELLEKSGVELAVVTDHMRWTFGVACAQHSSAQKGPNRLIILPGIELTAQFDLPTISDWKVHVLGIFPEGTSSQIERIFAGLPGIAVPGESERTGNETLSFVDIRDLVKAIKANGGLAIAAHVDNTNGARFMFISSAKLLLEPLEGTDPALFKQAYAKVGDEVKTVLGAFNALQVKSAKESVHYQKEDGELLLPLVLGTDAHAVGSFGKKESITWVKMALPTFGCLEKAFHFPDTRIRFLSNLPDSKPPRILGVSIVGAGKGTNTFFENLKLGFSDNLTTIVGPRGSGKSAVIDAIRYAFGYNRSLDEIGKLKDQIIERQEHTLAESRIDILYETREGVLRILSSTYDPDEEYTTRVYELDGTELVVEDVEQCGEFPLNLYGWNELELLGEQPGSQRENLDKFIHPLKALKHDRRNLYTSLQQNRVECMNKANALEPFFKEDSTKASILRIPEYQDAFNKLNTTEIRTKFEELDLLVAKMAILKDIRKKLDVFKTSVDSLSVIDMKTILAQTKDSPAHAWASLYLQDDLQWERLREGIREKRAELTSAQQAIRDKVHEDCVALETEHREVEKQIKSEIGTASAISAELRNNAKSRLEKAVAEYERYIKEYSTLKELLGQRDTLLDTIVQVNQKIFATRDAHKKTIIESIMVVQDEKFKIDLVLNQGNDRTDLTNFLAESPSHPDYAGMKYKASEMPAIISNKHDPVSLSKVFMAKVSSGLVGKIEVPGSGGSKTKSIDASTSEAIVDLNYPFIKVEAPDLTRVIPKRLENILKLQEVAYDDEFYIKLNDRPIQHCSPGQRCSAMLPIVTLTSEAPIIIDQPEDNLDNRLVSRAIFRILSKLKETRQIIVATHNPNIPVSGDAELVNVLETDGHLKTFGSIDDDGVVRDIIDLLEGGKEAFEKRQRRYQKYFQTKST